MTALTVQAAAAPAVRLRPYQEQAIEAVETAYAKGVRRPLVVIPTGGGKTVVFSSLIARRPGRALVLAHRDELIAQAAAKLQMVSGSLDIGIVKARTDEHAAGVVVASVQTLARPGRAERLGRFATVIVDEAHHAVAATFRGVLERLGCFTDPQVLTAGFTATAGRSDNVGLGAVWEEIAYQRGIIQMIAEGYLCDVKALQVGADFDLGNVRVAGGDYTDASIGAELERSHALDAAAEAYRRHAADRPGVAFTPTIATAHALAGALRGKGIAAEAVSGKTPGDERRAILARLHRGQTQVVANAALLTEGWDEPRVSCALMLRPTKSAPHFCQMAGRILRPFPGKDDALLLDIAGASEHGLATIATLAGLPPEAVRKGQTLLDAADEQAGLERQRIAIAAARTRQVELLRRSELRWLPVGDAWVLPAGGGQLMVLVPAGPSPDADAWEVWRCGKGGAPWLESGKPLTLEWARGVGEEVARARGGALSQADAAWRARPASRAQLRALASARYTGSADGLTCGRASDLLTAREAARAIRAIRKAGTR